MQGAVVENARIEKCKELVAHLHVLRNARIGNSRLQHWWKMRTVVPTK